MSRVKKQLVMCAVLAVLTIVAASPATAIPPPNGLRRVVTAAGSDSTQDVMAAILAQQNGNLSPNANPGTSRYRDNFVNLTPSPLAPGVSVPGDALCGSRTYVPGGNTDSDPRTVDPINGSSSGEAALASSAGSPSGSSGCVDIARSSAFSPNPTSFEHYAYARDAVSWAAFIGGQAPADLSSYHLQAIYSCVITDWSDSRLPPDAGSGQIIRVLTEDDVAGASVFYRNVLFRAAIPPNSVACPLVTLPGDAVTGIAVRDRVQSAALGRVIAPHFVAQWVAQGNGVLDDARSGLYMGNVNGLDLIDDGPPLAPNRTVINSGGFTGVHSAYNVLDTRSPSYTDALRAVGFDATGPGVLCSGALASVLIEYGYTPLPIVGGNACLLN